MKKKKRESPNGTATHNWRTFQEEAMDIVGPLPRTGRGNCIILVVTDYATRYPKAIALKSITAVKIPEVLIDIFPKTK